MLRMWTALAVAVAALLLVRPSTTLAADATVAFPDTSNAVILHKAQYTRTLQVVNFRNELATAVNAKRSEKGLRPLCINTYVPVSCVCVCTKRASLC